VVPDPVDDSRSPEPDADPETAAKNMCLRWLEGRPYTRVQLNDRLLERGVPTHVASSALDRLVEVGLVDDADYAAGYVATRQRDRGLSRRALATELRIKGVDDDAVAEAVGAISDDDERERAVALVERKLRSVRGLERPKQVNRLVGMLARKGYGASLAYSVVQEALAGDEG
jgi:regulatory protein